MSKELTVCVELAHMSRALSGKYLSRYQSRHSKKNYANRKKKCHSPGFDPGYPGWKSRALPQHQKLVQQQIKMLVSYFRLRK